MNKESVATYKRHCELTILAFIAKTIGSFKLDTGEEISSISVSMIDTASIGSKKIWNIGDVELTLHEPDVENRMIYCSANDHCKLSPHCQRSSKGIAVAIANYLPYAGKMCDYYISRENED